jgi:uncharacterized protein (DUF111 family)
MKKNRPAVALTVICDPKDEKATAEIIFKHTSSIGMRRTITDRIVMERRIESVETKFGPIQVKKCSYGDIEKVSPEYDSISAAAKKNRVSIREVAEELKDRKP